VLLLTPFLKAIFSIDVDALKRIVNYSIEGGIEYIGYYCRKCYLITRGKELVIETVIEANNGALPLVLGVGKQIPLSC
jgi:4-hydroxy-tetrahydrodipicolinate synthase